MPQFLETVTTQLWIPITILAFCLLVILALRKRTLFLTRENKALSAALDAYRKELAEAKISAEDLNEELNEQRAIANELKQAKADAESSNRTKSEFLAVMSHEIRTPLNAILGFSQLLHDEAQPEQKAYAESVLKGGEHLLTLINDVLDYSKMESRKLVLEPIDFSLIKLIKDIAHMFSASAQEKNLVLKIEIDPSIPTTLIGDKQRLKQVIYNLIGNAIKFTETGSIHIRVKTLKKTRKYCQLRIGIQDTGIGVPEANINSIFRPFTQAKQQINSVQKGSGLGLAISQKIISAMGGKIRCNSEDGKGSEFFFDVKLKIFEEDLFTLAQNNKRLLAEPRTQLNLKAPVIEDDSLNSTP